MSGHKIDLEQILTAEPLSEALGVLNYCGNDLEREGSYLVSFDSYTDAIVFDTQAAVGLPTSTRVGISSNQATVRQKYEQMTGNKYPRFSDYANTREFIKAFLEYKSWEAEQQQVDQSLLTYIDVPTGWKQFHEAVDACTQEDMDDMFDEGHRSYTLLTAHNHPHRKTAIPSPADLRSLNQEFTENIHNGYAASPLSLILANTPIKQNARHHVQVLQQLTPLDDPDWDKLTKGFADWYRNHTQYIPLVEIFGRAPPGPAGDVIKHYHIQDFFFDTQEQTLEPRDKSAYQRLNSIKDLQSKKSAAYDQQ